MALDPNGYLKKRGIRLTSRDAEADPEAEDVPSGFDPDAYLAKDAGGFDPDAYLAKDAGGFDPDAYLAKDVGMVTRAIDLPRAASGGAWQSIGRGLQGLAEINRALSAPARSLLPDSIQEFFDSDTAGYLSGRKLADEAGRGAENLGNFVAPPQERENLGTDIAAGTGQVVAQMGMSAVSPGLAFGMMAGEGAEQQSRRAEAAGTSGTAGADTAIIAGALVSGLTEKIQLGHLMKSTPYLGKLAGMLPDSIKNKWFGKVLDPLSAGVGEGAQEIVEGLLHDTIEYATYNDDVEFLQGWEREASAGAGTGLVFRTLLNAVMPGRARVHAEPVLAKDLDANPSEEVAALYESVPEERNAKPDTVADPKPKPQRAGFSVPPLADGNEDLLNAIEGLGGVRSPALVKDAGGEYDGFGEVFTGLAKRLVKRDRNVDAIDQLIEPLAELGYRFESPSDLMEGVRKAVETRELVKQKVNQEQANGRWAELAMSGLRAKNQARAELSPQPAAEMRPGDVFKIAGKESKVVAVDGFTGEVTVETDEKLGGRQVLEPTDSVYVDKGSYRFGESYYQQNKAPAEELPFAARAEVEDWQSVEFRSIEEHAAMKPSDRWDARAALAEKQKLWRDRAEQLAPGVMKRFRLEFGSPEQLVEKGKVSMARLDGTQQAAYDSQERMLYLFDEYLTTRSEANSLVNLQHEMAHAHWDTLDADTQDNLAKQMDKEVSKKSGPLFRNGELRPGVAQGVVDENGAPGDLKEWYAERVAWSNHKWARERVGMKPGKVLPATEPGVIGKAAKAMRSMLERMQKFIGLHFGGDRLLKGYRDFLQNGAKWESEAPRSKVSPVVDPLAMPEPSFAERQMEAAPESSSTNQEAYVKRRTLRERFSQSPIGRTVRREFDRLNKGRVGQVFRREALTVGNLPEIAWRKIAERNQRVAAIMRDVDFSIHDLNTAVSKTYGSWKSLPKGLEKGLNDVLAGRSRGEGFPAKVQGPLLEMRRKIDLMSRRLLEEGFAEGELKGVIEDNIGVYLNRSYKRYDVKGWGDKVMQAKPGSELAKVREHARAYIQSEMRERMLGDLADAEYQVRKLEAEPLADGRSPAPEAPGEAVQVDTGAGVPAKPGRVTARDRRSPLYWEILDRLRADKDLQPKASEVEGWLEDLAGVNESLNSDFGAATSKLGKDLSMFRKRKDLDPRIRKLMGEYTDARINFGRTVSKVAQVVETHRLLTDLRNDGLRQGWLSTKKLGGSSAQFAAEGSKTLAPLNGLYAPKEIVEAFQEQFAGDHAGTGWKIWWGVNSWAKISKTVYSPMTQSRNVTANFGFMGANGYLNPKYARNVWEAVSTDLLKGSDQRRRDYVLRLTRLGVLGESVNANELREAFRLGGTSLGDGNLDKWTDGVFLKTIKGSARAAAKAYQLGDEMFRVYAFEHERAAWTRAMPEASAAEVDAIAAERVSNVLPTYSRIPKAIQRVRRLGLTGSFVSFSSEVVRTTYHSLRYAVTDLQSKNPVVRAMGARRLAGMTMVAGFGGATISAISRALAGVTDEEDEDLRASLPEWSENSNLIYLGKDGKGNYSIVDGSYLNVWNWPHRVVTGAMRGEDLEASIWGGLRELADPVFGEGLVSGALGEIWANKTMDGRELANPELPFLDRTWEKLSHFLKAVEPGVSAQARRVYRAANGYEDATGRKYDLSEEVNAIWSGARPLSVNVGKAYEFRSTKYTSRLSDANAIFWKVYYSKGSNVTDEDKQAAYDQANAARKQIFEEMSEYTHKVLRGGVDPRVVVLALHRANVSTEDTVRLIKGQYENWQPTDNPVKKQESQYRRLRGLGLVR